MPISLRIDVSKVNYVGTDAIPTINAKPLSPSNTKDCSPSFFMDSKEKMPVPAIISFIPDVPTVSIYLYASEVHNCNLGFFGKYCLIH